MFKKPGGAHRAGIMSEREWVRGRDGRLFTKGEAR